eukprot:TRINITY_DN1572_c0_g1_i1.p1 TRINITY_DN1572_c0_g1~~TRINITY_DN1572_c0_g1_i1.p1  ORF type:complete len:117 (-),score=18.11 TRINITY_DN1572_c0_g1_i1:526-876(-)
MKKGELCNLICKPNYAYGAAGSPPKIPPNSTLKFEVELLDYEFLEKQEYEMDTPEKLETGLKYKEEANTKFKEGKLSEAIQLYEKVVNKDGLEESLLRFANPKLVIRLHQIYRRSR